MGNDVFKVPSFSVQNKVYLVDMNISLCQCTKGENGAPCKHQYVLWSRKFSCASNSFLPVFSALDRKRYAEIAVGESAPLFYYEGLQDRILAIDEVEKSDENMEVLENDLISQTNRLENTTDDGSDSSTSSINDAGRALDKAFQYLKSKLRENDPDPSLLSGAMKFSKRLLNCHQYTISVAENLDVNHKNELNEIPVVNDPDEHQMVQDETLQARIDEGNHKPQGLDMLQIIELNTFTSTSNISAAHLKTEHDMLFSTLFDTPNDNLDMVM